MRKVYRDATKITALRSAASIKETIIPIDARRVCAFAHLTACLNTRLEFDIKCIVCALIIRFPLRKGVSQDAQDLPFGH
tara:strand:- start:1601 stop:1837 length:237 start_codon:yes stop_codon:yes gene_type:complete